MNPSLALSHKKSGMRKQKLRVEGEERENAAIRKFEKNSITLMAPPEQILGN